MAYEDDLDDVPRPAGVGGDDAAGFERRPIGRRELFTDVGEAERRRRATRPVAAATHGLKPPVSPLRRRGSGGDCSEGRHPLPTVPALVCCAIGQGR